MSRNFDNLGDLPCSLRSATYTYELPQAQVAQEPPARRQDARLLELGLTAPGGCQLGDFLIESLPGLLRPGDLLVLNDTRVLKARVRGHREATGGQAEALILDTSAGACEALLRTRGHPAPGETFIFAGERLRATVVQPLGGGLYRMKTQPEGQELLALLEEFGSVPLPPYIRRDEAGDPRDAVDRDRYQTVYAQRPGAVAAPTAGLHLTKELLARVAERGVFSTSVTLHVGPGTFRPVLCDDLRDHPMHKERYHVPAEAVLAIAECRARGGRVVPVGTTTVRVLETATEPDGSLRAGVGVTDLFIHPPYKFKATDALLTNFHAPRSTLLMLIAALAGWEHVRAAYEHALAGGYRFLSYGDAMFIHRAGP